MPPINPSLQTEQAKSRSSRATANESRDRPFTGLSLPAVSPFPLTHAPVVQRIQIKLDGEKYYPAGHTSGEPVESDELTKEERQKASKNLKGKPELLLVQQGWRTAVGNIDPVIAGLVTAGLTDAGKKVKANRLYLASQDATGTLAALLAAQKEWQDFLLDEGIPKTAILSVHRSFGLEYEFATWEMIDPRAPVVKSHTIAGQTDAFSGLFGVPFVLETDAQQELELVGPPLLAGSAGGGVNKAFMKAAHDLFIAYLSGFRTDNQNTTVNAFPFAGDGIGHKWQWEPASGLIRLAGDRQKWADKPNQIGYQLNVTLKPEEIAAGIKAADDSGSRDGDEKHGDVYDGILKRFLDAKSYKDLSKPRKNAIDPAILILAKGLSNSIAIPTLSLVAQTHLPWVVKAGDLHSYVKDLHGLWIKDSVPNITVAAVTGDAQAKQDLAAILDVIGKEEGVVARYIVSNIPEYRPKGAAFKGEPKKLLEDHDGPVKESTRLKQAAKAEAVACMAQVKARLEAYRDLPHTNTPTDFLAEKFGTGDGVRKDTYLNIPRSSQSTLHLTELRSNASTDAFLA